MVRRLAFVIYALFLIIPHAHGQIASGAERAILEQQLKDIEAQIGAYEKTIGTYQKQGKSLNGEIAVMNAKTKKLNLEIQAITLSLAKLDKEIQKNKGDIVVTETKLQSHKQSLAAIVQSLHEEDTVNLAEMLVTSPTLSSFFNNMDGLVAVQGGLKNILQGTIETRDKLVDLKEQLAEKKTDTAQLKDSRAAQKQTIEETKREKNALLKETKGQESQYQALLKESQKTAAQIRNRIFEFAGGGELTFNKAYQIAKSAAGMVGIRPALLLAVLDGESALGRNVGRCNYQTAMHPTRDIPFFLALTARLGMNPDTTLVSCANRDGAYGGAMGVSQFIPATWNTFSARIQALTGNNPPSPWRHADAFVATALYMKDAGAGTEQNAEADRRAAARYYAGKRWQNYLWTYGERVVRKAAQFEGDIAVLQAAGMASL